MKRFLMIVLPILVLIAAGIGAHFIIKAKPVVKVQRPEVLPPLVRIQTVEMEDLSLTVKSQGTVSPRTESKLVPEISGRVIWISPNLISGGFFEEGDTLLKIDPHDYQQALIRARAEVAGRKLVLAQEEAEAEVARKEWEDLGEGEPTPLTLRLPQLEEAKAALASAEAALEQAQCDLERTEVKAPFAGRVRQEDVDVGQFVSRGSPVATLYAVDFAEIRLPLADDELAFLDLPLIYRGDESGETGPEVKITIHFAGKSHTWMGRIVRTEGEIDPRSRMVHAVAQVRDPYGRGEPGRPPLAVGMYVHAEIKGRSVENVAVLPRAALHGTNTIYVVDDSNRLRFREVDILRATRELVVVRSGLKEGEQVCLTPLEAVTDGMRVRTPEPVKDPASELAEGDES